MDLSVQLVWVVTLAAVVVLGVDLGLLAGVVFSIFTVIVRTQAPKCEIVASVNGTDVYRNCVKYNSVGIKLRHELIETFKQFYYMESSWN